MARSSRIIVISAGLSAALLSNTAAFALERLPIPKSLPAPSPSPVPSALPTPSAINTSGAERLNTTNPQRVNVTEASNPFAPGGAGARSQTTDEAEPESVQAPDQESTRPEAVSKSRGLDVLNSFAFNEKQLGYIARVKEASTQANEQMWAAQDGMMEEMQKQFANKKLDFAAISKMQADLTGRVLPLLVQANQDVAKVITEITPEQKARVSDVVSAIARDASARMPEIQKRLAAK